MLRDGVILPGKSELGGIYDYDKSDLAIENTEVVYLGMMISIWGHCLTDNLKRLWFIFDEKYGHLKHLKWVYTMLSGDGFQSDDNFCALLSHLGIDLFNYPLAELEKREKAAKKITKIDKPTKFRKIYIPDDCFIKDNDNHYYTNEFKVIIDDLINDVRNSCTNFIGADKVYFTRTQLKNNGRDNGEKQVELFFKEQGFEVYDPLGLTFDQQVSLLQSCNSFATTEGPIAHNAMFLKEGTRMITIRKAYYCNGYQFAINQMKKLNVVLIDSHMSVFANPLGPWSGPFYLYVNRHLMDYFNCKRKIRLEGFANYLSKNWFLFLKRYVKKMLKSWKK